ncbi:MAG: short-chain dehydrogenase [Gemmatimonadetes bacterium]|uniref:Short-chain dehydrogenase n=1 Tax=Candidatus Kutchimonas denitrificans TaxID=3056748 RepID=A0AAE5CCJ0_9BACT|nr:short-chain dehydrogenase [Gemmatimonadota bacterium]NIR76008.1 short-chain dehydrogenase [Candidatus Kutchimonas denitrificans]NIS02200.1 short-chain dehydrogenase [Gemmatimonadota bacterium]NIT68026.1 short-chain dehydrogenase [Gemmatimonadota bacterium]NIU54052.1 short-chain dehydrogenase [Gemmatimonadota bacterium]
MEIRNTRVLILGGSGLVGMAIARQMLPHEPARLTITALTEEETEEPFAELQKAAGDATEVARAWGDLFVATEFKDTPRRELIESAEKRTRLLDDVYGALDEGRLRRAFFYSLLQDEKPDIIIDCVNTATAIAYQDVFTSVKEIRAAIGQGDDVGDIVERHLTVLYMPQLIRHVRILLEALRDAGVEFYLKVGTSGTGGMGLNVPFTHSEARPSNMLLAKSSVAGAHSLLLFLTARTPGAPAVKEIKPTAAIAWKAIRKGRLRWRGQEIPRFDATDPVPLERALHDGAGSWKELGGGLEAVYIDMGENGLFSKDEFETISALGLMELVTTEEIATAVLREIRGQPTGLDVVSAIDGAAMGPTYRGGVLRELALKRMEELEQETGSRSVAFEMLGPPRLSKLLFEAYILERLYETLPAAADLDPDETAAAAESFLRENDEARINILSIGLPILNADGKTVLRGPDVKSRPESGAEVDERVISRGWVDLRSQNWETWRGRIRKYLDEVRAQPGPDEGSVADADLSTRSNRLRPGAAAAWVFKFEDGGLRLKR